MRTDCDHIHSEMDARENVGDYQIVDQVGGNAMNEDKEYRKKKGILKYASSSFSLFCCPMLFCFAFQSKKTLDP